MSYRPSRYQTRQVDFWIKTFAAILFIVTIMIAARCEGEELRFEDQVTREERQAVSKLIIANLIRRQNERERIDQPREYVDYVGEEEYPSKSRPNAEPLPSPSQRSWRVKVYDGSIANPDPWGFWATIPVTTYRVTNGDGDTASIVIEWR